MKSWTRALNDATLSGGLASALSAIMLAWRGRRDVGAGAAPLNAPTHWLSDKALRQARPSLRYTLTGMIVHHLSSVFWAVFFERGCPNGGRDAPTALRDAAAVSAMAAVVDLQLVPERLTPGFEHHLSARSLFLVYATFAAGLALGSMLAGTSAAPNARGRSMRPTVAHRLRP